MQRLLLALLLVAGCSPERDESVPESGDLESVYGGWESIGSPPGVGVWRLECTHGWLIYAWRADSVALTFVPDMLKKGWK